MRIKLSLFDVAADFRRQFGDKAEEVGTEILGRPLPEHDWRWHIEFGPDSNVTFGFRATAEEVAEHMAKEGWDL